MKRIVVLLAIIFYVTMVRGRNLNDDNLESEDIDDGHQDKHVRDHTNSQMRHRRRPRQSYYNHFSSYNPYDDFYGRRRDDRRDYSSRQQEELLSRILEQIEELSIHIKKAQSPPPAPPPQIIYVPLPYPVPQCINPTKPFTPNLTDRWNNMNDKNQNWGLIPGNLGMDNDDGSDGSRPINLDPVVSDEPTVKPPPVEHGSSQAGMTTARPNFSEPGRCKAAILVCCQDTSDREKQQCFANYGCNKTYSLARSCDPNVLKRVIAEFAEAYAPINNT
ncbi:uncharacterized protein [Maniola hyperantus]|uniref:uncharacterized protein isoform X1 n=1 Tax=Aphantopus hyperantus TaxID=2795564 RepID=UPI001567DB8F|nr:uncharacterized protein LOC117987028 isoform X1 [Maniola hyperantus]XP_034829883.1 uncharacterized protein LOC117987028 isoform X1 [Maniola hyperantus]